MQLRMPKIGTSEPKTNGISGTVEDVRRIVSQGAEQVADQVAKVAEQIGTGAANLGQEAGREAGKLSREVSVEATKLGRDWRSSSEQNLRNLGKDVRALSKDVRQLRVTRQASGPNIMPGIALLAGLGGGLAVMYFYDPEQGRQRRTMLRDQIGKWTRIGRERLSGRAEDLRNRTIGLTHEAKTAFRDTTEDISSEASTGGIGDSPDVSDELARTDQAVPSEVGY